MKRYITIVISVLLCACSPQDMSGTATSIPTEVDPTVTDSPLALEEPPNPRFIESATPVSPEPTKLNFELPPECSIYDPAISTYYYADLSHGSCNQPTLSPDESQIAYATFRITESGEIVQEARLFSRSLEQSFPIYMSKCGVLYMEWTPTKHLVISDRPQDVGCGYTAIYDITRDEIIATVDGIAYGNWRHAWSEDQTAFFTVGPETFGPVCSETLSGFDLISSQPIPSIRPITPNTNIYVVIGDPVWSKEDRKLLVVIRDGTCTDPGSYECTYRNSYIVSIDFGGSLPTITYPFYNVETDYSIVESDDGKLEIKSAPMKANDCYDVHIEESK